MKRFTRFLAKVKDLLFARTEITIQIIERGFSRVEEKRNPPVILIEGVEVAKECRKVMEIGNSNAVTLKGGWVNLASHRGYVKQQLITNSEGKTYYILLSKPEEELIPA